MNGWSDSAASGAALLAVGVVHPALLGGLGLAAIPIVIHLLSRRRYRRVPWGAVRFLLEADRRNRRRIRFEQWLLVALRCLAMGLLGLMVARPFVRPGLVASMIGSRGPVQRVLVLDDSASLACGVGEDTDFVRARGAALRLLDWLRQEAPNDPVRVYRTSDPSAPLAVAVPANDAAWRELRARVGSLACSAARARPRRTLAAIAAALAESGARLQADVYVFSDFQRSDWTSGASAGDAEAVFAPLSAAPQLDVRAVLIQSAAARRDNVAVEALALTRPQAVAGVSCGVRIDVANHSAQTLHDVQLRLAIDGVPVPTEPIDAIAAGARRSVSAEVVFPDAGSRELVAAVDGRDRFGIDDTRRAAVGVAEALRVLIVDGQPALDAYDDEVFLLRSAMAPQGRVWSGVRVEVIDPSELETADLGAFDALMLCNVPAPTEREVELLVRYVRRGGGLVIFVGDQVEPELYNARLWRGGSGPLPAPLRRVVSVPAGSPGLPLVPTADHPLAAAFVDGAATDYARFRTIVECDVPDADSSTSSDTTGAVVAARYGDASASPAIIEKTHGAGRVVMFTSTCDLDWNNWAGSIDGTFVVTMQELVQHVARRGGREAEFLAGDPLSVRIPPDLPLVSAVFKTPRFPDEPALRVAVAETPATASDAYTLTGPRGDYPGTYVCQLTHRSGATETRLLCVNVDPAESELVAATPAEIDVQLAGIPYELVSLDRGFPGDVQEARHELWPALLVTLVVVLLVEQGLAWWFGGGARPAGRGGPSSGDAARRPRRRSTAGPTPPDGAGIADPRARGDGAPGASPAAAAQRNASTVAPVPVGSSQRVTEEVA